MFLGLQEERYEEELENFETKENESKTNSRKGLRSRSKTNKDVNAAAIPGIAGGTVLGANGVLYTWDGTEFTDADDKIYSAEQVYSIVATDDAKNYKPVTLP